VAAARSSPLQHLARCTAIAEKHTHSNHKRQNERVGT
jgi:hypothetical protein